MATEWLKRREWGPTPSRRLILDQFKTKKSNLHSCELRAHFGCVNALCFAKNTSHGVFLASGGDDRRILVWNMSKAVDGICKASKSSAIMDAKHESNVFCLDFDCESRKVVSGGNDEKVILHDLQTGKTLDVFPHDQPVYCTSCHPENPELFATASSDGQVLLFDLRTSEEEEPTQLAVSSKAFHGVAFNPTEPRLVVTANQCEGVALMDIRKPQKPVMKYGSCLSRRSAMCAQFSADGSKIFVLGRRQGPLLYDISSPVALAEFDHHGYFNSCTMKSGCFGDGYVYSGSDDYNLYGWKVPDFDKQDSKETLQIRSADMLLKGHRSIVNQVRYEPNFSILASSGVEKMIKLWSPFPLSQKRSSNRQAQDGDGNGTGNDRRRNRRDDFFWWMTLGDSMISHDCNRESTEENPNMIAFFDSLVKRDIDSSSSDATDSDDADLEDVRSRTERTVLRLRSRRRNDSSSDENIPNDDSGDRGQNEDMDAENNDTSSNDDGDATSSTTQSAPTSPSRPTVREIIERKRRLALERRRQRASNDSDHIRRTLVAAKEAIDSSDTNSDDTTESADNVGNDDSSDRNEGDQLLPAALRVKPPASDSVINQQILLKLEEELKCGDEEEEEDDTEPMASTSTSSANNNSTSTSSSSAGASESNSNSEKPTFKKGKGGKGRSYRRQDS